MNLKFFFYLFGLVCLIAACEEHYNAEEISNVVKKELFDGYVQKGPFSSGSSVIIYELDDALNQTGKSFATSIINNKGNFEQKNFELVTQYVQLKADGYYFNEVTGKTSVGQISLYALIDISNANSANINVLTHSERARVEYLLKEKSFTEAKQQAQKEILDIFCLNLQTVTASESLNLTEDAVLLAVSCILQGSLSVGDMVELMANISADIRTDGKLDNPVLGSQLVDNAKTLHLSDVRKNLENKYAEISQTKIIPDFEQYVQLFLDNTPYQQTLFITYPKEGASGINILSNETTAVIAGQPYSMTADIPAGFQLKVVLKGGLWFYGSLPAPENWRVSVYDISNETQEFVNIESGKKSDLLFFPDQGVLNNADQKYYTTIEYYENQSQTPVFTKKLQILPPEQPVSPTDSSFIWIMEDYWTIQTMELQTRNKNKLGITGGIYGTLVKSEGNCMQTRTYNGPCNQFPIKRTIVVYEYTTADKTKQTNNAFYEVYTRRIATTTCDDEGFFELALEPGEYSVFVQEDGYLYANKFNAKGGIARVVVTTSDVSEFNLNLVYNE